jgi:carbohydrate kinase (thermoresistant glucokinase family)
VTLPQAITAVLDPGPARDTLLEPVVAGAAGRLVYGGADGSWAPAGRREERTVIVILAGVSGSGKTTIGELLALRLGWPFTDGDRLHPAANIAKMASGHPLTDQDREPWLAAIGASMDERIAAGQSALVACSALKRRYRAVLLNGRPEARIAFLEITKAEAAARLAGRHGHFFDPALLDSQFADLEPPVPEETAVVPVPVSEDPAVTAAAVISRLGLDGAAHV